MKERLVMVFLMLFFMGWTGTGFAEKKTQIDSKDINSVGIKAESIDQLVEFIKSAVESKDSKRLDQIKKENVGLVKGNLLLILSHIYKTLEIAISKDSSVNDKIKKQYFAISKVLSEFFADATNNNFLLNRYLLFHKWKKSDLEKYWEAQKLFKAGFKDSEDFKYDEAIENYSKSKSLNNEIGHKEGVAHCLRSIGDIKRKTSQYDSALYYFEESLKICQVINDWLGVANCNFYISYIYQGQSLNDKAISKLKESLYIYCKIKDRLGEANTLKAMGHINSNLCYYKEAIKLYEESLSIYRQLKDQWSEANSLSYLSIAYMGLSNYEKARQITEESLEISVKTKNRICESDCLKMLGVIHSLLSENQKAYQYFEKSLSVCKITNDPLGQADCLDYLGDIDELNEDNNEAFKKYEESLKINRQIKNPLREANSLINIAKIKRKLNNNAEAIQKINESLAIYRNIKFTTGEANALLELGETYRIISSPEKSIQNLEEAQSKFRDIGNKLGEANCLMIIGGIYLELEEFEKALQKNTESYEIFRELKHRMGEVNTLINIGEDLNYMQKYEESIKRFNEALSLAREINFKNGELTCLQGIATLFKNKNDFKNMLSYTKDALEISRKIENFISEAYCLRLLGDYYKNFNHHHKAIGEYHNSFLIEEKSGHLSGMAESLYKNAEIYETIHNFSKAKINYEKSINLLENIWGDMRSESFKTRYFSTSIGTYMSFINFLFNHGNKTEAFSYAERSKARSFLYLLGNKHIDINKGISPELAKEEQELRRQINVLSAKLMSNEEKEPEKRAKRVTTDEWNDELLKLKQKHSETLEKIKLNSPEYASLLTVNPLSLKEIQLLIQKDKNTSLIEYYSTPDHLFMWLLDGKHIYSHKTNISQKSLDSKIKVYTSMISNVNTNMNEISPRAQKLYNLLLKPFEKYLHNKPYIAIVPHNSLHYLPFETLMNNKKFLTEQNFKIFYLPSASVYKYCKEKNQLNKQTITAFVNPDGSLPYSENEAHAIQQLFTPQNMKIISGKNATESEAKNTVENADIIHFACHGSFESNHPLYSALLLNPDKDNDGRLETSEIFQLKLKPAYLVTLSACETHMGSISPGDEIIGLTRAFIYAGTPSILASLWKVDDEFTGKLMESFYKNLQSSNKIDALHSARTEMITQYNKRHPFYWSSFVLIGDPK